MHNYYMDTLTLNDLYTSLNSLLYVNLVTSHSIKTHDGELRDQEEAATSE